MRWDGAGRVLADPAPPPRPTGRIPWSPVPAREPLTIDTVGGRQPLRVYTPDSGDPAGPVVAVSPALGIRADYYGAFAEALAARGLRVVLADHPGHGASPVRAGRGADWSYRDLVCVHAEAIHAAARARFPDAPFVWLGHSLGAQVALLHAGRAPDTVAAVATIAAGTPYYAGWQGAWRPFMRVAPRACSLLTRPLGYFPGHRVGFGGREAKSLIRDWARLARAGTFRFAGFDGEALLARWTGPTLAISLAGDDFAPPGSHAHLVGKTPAPVTWWTWHAPPDVDHNRWPRQPEAPAERVATWLGEVGVRRTA